MKRKLTGDDAEFAKLQRDWQKQVQKFMTKAIQFHNKTTELPNPAGMQETLLFSIMWIEFIEAYKYLSPATFDEDVGFLRHMFNKIMDGKLPGNMRWQDTNGNDVGPADSDIYKKPTIN